MRFHGDIVYESRLNNVLLYIKQLKSFQQDAVLCKSLCVAHKTKPLCLALLTTVIDSYLKHCKNVCLFYNLFVHLREESHIKLVYFKDKESESVIKKLGSFGPLNCQIIKCIFWTLFLVNDLLVFGLRYSSEQFYTWRIVTNDVHCIYLRNIFIPNSKYFMVQGIENKHCGGFQLFPPSIGHFVVNLHRSNLHIYMRCDWFILHRPEGFKFAFFRSEIEKRDKKFLGLGTHIL